jgi:hypothetical protein
MKKLVYIIVLSFNICSAQNAINNTGEFLEIHFTVRINLKFPADTSNLLQIEDFDSVFYDQAVLMLPKTYSETGKPVRLVYCAHGAGGGVSNDSWYLASTLLDDSLLANGYAIFDVNGGPSVENMGGSWVVQSAFKA